MKEATTTASVRFLRVALLSRISWECDIVFDSLWWEGEGSLKGFIQPFYHGGTGISCRSSTAENVNLSYTCGDQTHWTPCKLTFGQDSIY